MGYPIKVNSNNQPLVFLLTDSTTKLGKLNAASIVVTLSKNGGAPVTPQGAVSQVGGGLYKVAGNSMDSNNPGPLILKATATGCDESFETFHVVGYDPLGVLVPDAEKLAIASLVLDNSFIAYSPTNIAVGYVYGAAYVRGDRAIYVRDRASVANIVLNDTGATEVDLRGCLSLCQFIASGCALSALDLTGLNQMNYIDITGSRVSSLDLSDCPAIGGLLVGGNRLSAIALSPTMSTVNVSGNRLAALDLTGLTALADLNCSDNLLTALDVGDCAVLATLDCSGNQLTAIDRLDNIIGHVTSLKCSRNQFPVLSFGPLSYGLSVLHCDNINTLWSLDVAQATGLSELHCHDTQIQTLTNYGPGLREVDCARCMIFQLLLNWSSLVTLDCSSNNLSSLTVESAPSLQTLNCSGNPITVLANLTNAPMLQTLNCRTTQLTELSLFGMFNLATVDCSRCLLTSFDLNGSSISDTLDCSWNSIGAINLLSLSTVRHINCSNNQIMNVDASACLALETLDVSYNLLGNLTLDSITTLTSLNASNNPGMFTFPSLLSNPGLVNLDVSYCNLPEAVLNQILADLVANGATGGTLNMVGQSPDAGPTGQGVTDASTLANDRGWTIQAWGFYS